MEYRCCNTSSRVGKGWHRVYQLFVSINRNWFESYLHFRKLRYIAFSITFFAFQAVASGWSQNVSFSFENADLKKVFDEIQKQSDFDIIYPSVFLKRANPVTVRVENKPLSEVLQLCFVNQPFTYVVEDSAIVIKRFDRDNTSQRLRSRNLNIDRSYSAIDTLRGVVSNREGEPLIGVNVKLKKQVKGTITDFDGKFVLANINAGDTLVFSYVGYTSKEINVTGTRSEINVVLLEDAQTIEEVVVVGYGIQKKVSVTGSVTSVDEKELKKSSSASLASALAGRLSGLTTIQTGGGQPGRDDPTMYLRGAATTNGQSPLILIDGVPRDNIRTLDANEVESVSILKDASATAVFGVRGANGVILITTKRGEEGKMDLNISLDQSLTSFTREPERIHSEEYMRIRNEAAKNDGIVDAPFPEDVIQKYMDPLAGLDPSDPDFEEKARIRNYLYPDHDYYREYISRYTPQTRVNVNASGGTEKVQYFVNGGFLHQGGNLKTEPASELGYDPSSWMDRFNFRANLDYQVTSNLKSFLNIGSYIEKVNMPSADLYGGGDTRWMITDLMYQAQTILPITPGPVTIDGFGVEPGQIVDPGYLDRSAFEIMNRMGYRREVRSNLNSTLGLEWDLGESITRGLSIKGMVSYDARATTAMQGSKRERLFLADVNYDTDELSYAIKRNDESLLSLVKGADSRYSINLQGSINYNRTFNNVHSVGGMILAQRDYWESTIGEIPYNVLGVAGRATYAYDNRYLAEFNLGYNGSEQFAPSQRFGFFPAVSIGWVVSQEKFLRNSDLITNLKLRASVGRVGNDKIGSARFLYQSDITIGGGPLGSLGRGQGVNQGLLGNPNITWELAEKQNYGLDVEFNSELSLALDYFLEDRTDILISRGTVPQFQGVPLGNIPKVNLGEVENKGFEVELSYNKIVTNNIDFQVRGNLGFNKNNVVFLDEPIRDETYAYRYRSTGYPLGQNWGYKIDYTNGNGIFNSSEELESYLSSTVYGFGDPRVGDFIYQDLNEDGVINDKDQAPIGFSSIPGLTYGISLTVRLGAFDFSTFFQGVGRYSGHFANQGVYEYTKQGTYFDYHKTAWTPERYANGEEITYPALSTRSTTNHVANDFFIMDRSYTRLRNVELAYTLPPNVLQVLGVKSLRVYAGGQNLFTWDNMEMGHLDPEVSSPIGYPITKMINMGLNISF